MTGSDLDEQRRSNLKSTLEDILRATLWMNEAVIKSQGRVLEELCQNWEQDARRVEEGQRGLALVVEETVLERLAFRPIGNTFYLCLPLLTFEEYTDSKPAVDCLQEMADCARAVDISADVLIYRILRAALKRVRGAMPSLSVFCGGHISIALCERSSFRLILQSY